MTIIIPPTDDITPDDSQRNFIDQLSRRCIVRDRHGEPVLDQELAATRLAIRERATARMRWIPCSERLPDPGINVLYFTKHGDEPLIGSRRKLDEQWYWGSDFGDYDHMVTHWMPLPEPP